MKASDEGASRDLLGDIRNRRVCVVGACDVVHREKDSSNYLGKQDIQQARAKHIGPAGSAGYWFIERLMRQFANSCALIEPPDEAVLFSRSGDTLIVRVWHGSFCNSRLR